MPFTIEVNDAVRVVIDQIAERHGMTREQVVTAAVSALKFFDDTNHAGRSVSVGNALSGSRLVREVDWEDFIDHAKES